MEKKFIDLSEIKDRTTFDEVSAYLNDLINEATNTGALSQQNPDNEYTREIGRISILCANYEDNVLNLSRLSDTRIHKENNNRNSQKAIQQTQYPSRHHTHICLKEY